MNPQRRGEWSSWAFVALGSNLGNSVGVIHETFQELQKLSAQPLRKSSLWQSTPVDCPPGSPMFVNAVAALLPQAGQTPESLLARLQALESQAGRRSKKVLNEPRPLDLDLIIFGSEMRNSPALVLPHPRACQRRFVLEPLNEIAPELIFPGEKSTVSELLAALSTDEVLTRIPEAPHDI